MSISPFSAGQGLAQQPYIFLRVRPLQARAPRCRLPSPAAAPALSAPGLAPPPRGDADLAPFQLPSARSLSPDSSKSARAADTVLTQGGGLTGPPKRPSVSSRPAAASGTPLPSEPAAGGSPRRPLPPRRAAPGSRSVPRGAGLEQGIPLAPPSRAGVPRSRRAPHPTPRSEIPPASSPPRRQDPRPARPRRRGGGWAARGSGKTFPFGSLLPSGPGRSRGRNLVRSPAKSSPAPAPRAPRARLMAPGPRGPPDSPGEGAPGARREPGPGRAGGSLTLGESVGESEDPDEEAQHAVRPPCAPAAGPGVGEERGAGWGGGAGPRPPPARPAHARTRTPPCAQLLPFPPLGPSLLPGRRCALSRPLAPPLALIISRLRLYLSGSLSSLLARPSRLLSPSRPPSSPDVYSSSRPPPPAPRARAHSHPAPERRWGESKEKEGSRGVTSAPSAGAGTGTAGHRPARLPPLDVQPRVPGGGARLEEGGGARAGDRDVGEEECARASGWEWAGGGSRGPQA